MPPSGPTTHVMGKLSATQVAQYARNAGFPASEIPMAVEVARLESGFDPNKEGLIDPRDKGLFQINSHYHPEVLSINWKDPQANTNLARQIWQQRGWGEWHTSGRARFNLLGKTTTGQESTAAASSAKATESQAEALRNVGSSILGPIEALNRIGSWISEPANWVRVIEVVVGGALVLVGLAVVARPVAAPIVSTAAEFTPAGRATSAWFKGRPA